MAAAAELADQRLPAVLPGKAVDLMDEAASLQRMRRATLRPDLREYDEKIAQVRKDKESEIDKQDFEKAAALRDTEKQLLAKKATREKEFVASTMDEVAEVDESVGSREHCRSCSGLPPATRVPGNSRPLRRLRRSPRRPR